MCVWKGLISTNGGLGLFMFFSTFFFFFLSYSTNNAYILDSFVDTIIGIKGLLVKGKPCTQMQSGLVKHCTSKK